MDNYASSSHVRCLPLSTKGKQTVTVSQGAAPQTSGNRSVSLVQKLRVSFRLS